jgi:hypothetical protein
LALANSCGSIPPGADGVSTWAWGRGASGFVPACGVGINTDGKTLELAADDSMAPAAPMAPRRRISRRFKVTDCPPEANRVFIIQWVNGR